MTTSLSASDDYKLQRDRYLAFAFSASDLLLEVKMDGVIQFALGAATSLTGEADKALVGRNWLDLFAQKDHPLITSLIERYEPGQRFGPILVELNQDRIQTKRKGLITGLAMPGGADVLYVTVSKGSISAAEIGSANRDTEDKALLETNAFIAASQNVMKKARDIGEDVNMTLLDLPNAEHVKSSLDPGEWESFTENLAMLLRSQSVDGQTAGALAEGKYSVVHDTSTNAAQIKQMVSDLASSIDSGQVKLDVSSTEIDGSQAEALTDREMQMALLYTIDQFKADEDNFSLTSLKDGLGSYIAKNALKIAEFKSTIYQQRFELAFQPIVSSQDFSCSHYEVLIRFDEGKSPYEMILFGENVGLAPDLDLAVVSRALNFVVMRQKDTAHKFAVNLSGLSMQSDIFFDTLIEKLRAQKDFADRLLFEITESTEINDFEKVNYYIKTLQKEGFKVCLDDFGAGAASFQYLHKLHVNYVKIDGVYSRSILQSERDAAMVKNLTQMCKDLDVKVVAEMVENKVQAKFLRDLGVDYLQGYLFSKPLDQPNYKQPS